MENYITQATSKRWIISPLIPPSVNQNLTEFSPLLRQLLYNRGISDANSARAFVDCASSAPTDPFLIKDMSAAVELLHHAIPSGIPIAIYGDYDVDGVTSTALLYEFLQQLGSMPRVYIPNRFEEGYGLNPEAIQQLASEGIGLIITVDCGIRSVAEVALARELGMRVILSDHHLPGQDLPSADAIINPRQPGDTYPYKHMAGVGLAYKIVQAYLTSYPIEGMQADNWLDLVAIGTVADLAPLTDENRALVHSGMQVMRSMNRQGLYSLAQISGIKLEKINAGNIGFGIAPRLNAAGRLDSAMAAFDLLTTRDLVQAGTLAQQLDSQNSHRKDITLQIQTVAVESALKADPTVPIIFAASPDFNEGVVGLAASRITEALYKPAIIGHQSGSFVVASCRSIAEFDITGALDACSDLLIRYGGHSMAAGLTVSNENLPALLERLNTQARKTLAGLELAPVLGIDREIFLDKLRAEHVPGIMEDVSLLEPTGRGNPEALFCSRNLQVKQARAVGDGQHLKLTLRAGTKDYDGIAFRQGYWLEEMPNLVDIAYAFDINNYMGRQTLQLNIKDIKPSVDER